LAYVVRRRDPARLLILGTYRPVDVIMHAHALRSIVAELRHHPQYAELVLDYLSAATVAMYLRQRCGEKPVPTDLAQLLHQRTGGNPLFLVAMVDELVRQGVLETERKTGGSRRALAVLSRLVPTSLRQYIEQHLEQLSEADQALLEAASVAGHTFSVAAVAAGVAQAPETLEARYTAFARHGRFIRASGTETWPNGTVTACYQFMHALYHEVVYARVSAGHRVHLHQQIGARKEAGYGAQARQIAAELAGHFARGRDTWRAVQYLQYAGENALQRSAYQEAIPHLTTGLEVLQTLPDTPARAQRELALQLRLGSAFIVSKGWAAPDVERVYTRAHELCAQLGPVPQRFRALNGLHAFHLVRAGLQTAWELGEQFSRLAQSVQHPRALLWAHFQMGETLFYLGEFAAARIHFAQGIALYPSQSHDPRLLRATDAGVGCHSWAAYVLWVLGYPDQALQYMEEALTLAQELSQPFNLAYALDMAAELHQFRQEGPLTQARADALLALSTGQGFAAREAQGMYLRGWALAKQGQVETGIGQICQGIAAWQATGAAIGQPYQLALLAEVYSIAGHIMEGLRVVAEALAGVSRTREQWYTAELYRLNGELLLMQATPDEMHAATCFQQALAVARRQQAKSLELRAAISLSRLWQHQGKRAAAYDLLAPVYGWFTEGFDTADLQEARVLLEDLEI
jgi:predicted ATPase